jgi:lysozyme
MTDEVLDDLRDEEGWRAHPYHDHLGVLTIGYGFVIDPKKKGGGLPRPVAEFWLRYAVNERTDALRKLWPAFDDQPSDVKRALTLMAFQMGADGVSKFRRMLAALAAGDRVTAAEEALDSEWAEQTPARAKRVSRLIGGRA